MQPNLRSKAASAQYSKHREQNTVDAPIHTLVNDPVHLNAQSFQLGKRCSLLLCQFLFVFHMYLRLRFIDGISLHQMPRKLAQAQAAFAQTRQHFCGDGLQDGFCIFVTVRVFFAERVASSASLLQRGQQRFLRTFQHRQRVKHRRRAHLAAGQQDTAPAGRHRRHRGHYRQLTLRGHFRLHLQLQLEHRFCLFHVLSF